MTRCLVRIWLLTAICGVCGCDAGIKDAPPKDRLCGIWVIDPERTTWREARPLLASGDIGPQRGYLELKSDGEFLISDLPDFSHCGPSSIVPHQDGAGTWCVKFDAMSKASYLWLDFEEMNGKPAKDKSASFDFQKRGADYFLKTIIWDPDSGDVLVLRQKGDAPRTAPGSDRNSLR